MPMTEGRRLEVLHLISQYNIAGMEGENKKYVPPFVARKYRQLPQVAEQIGGVTVEELDECLRWVEPQLPELD